MVRVQRDNTSERFVKMERNIKRELLEYLANALGDITIKLERCRSGKIGESGNNRMSANVGGWIEEVRISKIVPKRSTRDLNRVSIGTYIYLASVESIE
jgi:hypothetical protein